MARGRERLPHRRRHRGPGAQCKPRTTTCRWSALSCLRSSPKGGVRPRGRPLNVLPTPTGCSAMATPSARRSKRSAPSSLATTASTSARIRWRGSRRTRPPSSSSASYRRPWTPRLRYARCWTGSRCVTRRAGRRTSASSGPSVGMRSRASFTCQCWGRPVRPRCGSSATCSTRTLTGWPGGSRLRFRLIGGAPALVSGFQPRNLLDGIYWHLADAVVGGKCRMCLDCGRFFIVHA